MKIVNDCVHGPIVLLPVTWAFIDTKPFQRLRNIAQLGMTSWVYPTAGHCRFEHCIGTAHLAGKLVRQIRQSQPELEINDKDVMCAELAGLLYDIGLGPFSRCWNHYIVPALLDTQCDHKKASIDIIEWMLPEESPFRKRLEREFGLKKEDIQVIKEMILPDLEEKHLKKDDPKSFLYDVVSNSFLGLDVVKLDYLARDGKYLGTARLETEELQRLIVTAIVFNTGTEEDKDYHLVWRDVAASTLHNIFQLRHRLHCTAYQHKTAVSIDLMFADAMKKADGVNKFSQFYEKVASSQQVQLKKDPECIEKFLRLTDSVFWNTLYSEDESLKESRAILERIPSRNHYPNLCSIRLPGDEFIKKYNQECPEKHIKQDIVELIENDLIDQGLTNEDLRKKKMKYEKSMIIKVCTFTFGSTPKAKKNPLEILVCRDRSGNVIKSTMKSYVSLMFSPKHFTEMDIRLYSRSLKDEKNKELQEYFRRWIEENEVVVNREERSATSNNCGGTHVQYELSQEESGVST